MATQSKVAPIVRAARPSTCIIPPDAAPSDLRRRGVLVLQFGDAVGLPAADQGVGPEDYSGHSGRNGICDFRFMPESVILLNVFHISIVTELMDKRIRKNEICVVGLPRCDFVFSSTRSCFIAYGFDTSPLEMNILKNLLEDRGLVVEEAGGALAPAQSAFCAKICSKIITSQFCVVLLNNDLRDGVETPNANVNMEYGLMLGFNKYVIPFQRENQTLPFNVANLDTVKYTDRNFQQKALEAIGQAITETTQETVPRDTSDQNLQLFFMERGLLISPVDNEGDRNLYRLGDFLGFNLLNNFSGDKYLYFGRFASLRPESTVWRLRKLNAVLSGRRDSIPDRVAQGIITEQHRPFVERLFKTIQMLVIVAGEADKQKVVEQLSEQPLEYHVEVLTVEEALDEIGKALPGDV